MLEIIPFLIDLKIIILTLYIVFIRFGIESEDSEIMPEFFGDEKLVKKLSKSISKLATLIDLKNHKRKHSFLWALILMVQFLIL